MANHEKARKFGEAAADTFSDAVDYHQQQQATRAHSIAAGEARVRMRNSLSSAKEEFSKGNLLNSAGHFINAISESNTCSAHAREAHNHSSQQQAAVQRTSDRLFGDGKSNKKTSESRLVATEPWNLEQLVNALRD